ncbi:aminotransferase class IV [Dendrosporobacter sp. 1207_IL3150]|uniref:aminotransferase class IV n=1 Tax=Dendrosporobacter sp. 1207_IL3150 TaxID=3084054 RepID=UPI002FD8876E
MEGKIYFNGRIVSVDDARISVCDHGFLYGNSLFETMRVYNGRIFRSREHIKRLIDSAKSLNWGHQFCPDKLSEVLYATLDQNELKDGVLRLTISRGKGLARPDALCEHPTIVVYAFKYQPPPLSEYQGGWPAAIVSIRRNETSPLCRIKSGNYLDNMLARSEARAKGANEALLLNTIGNVTEGTIANYFFVIKGILVTADIESGLLPGVTRQVVLELAQKLSIKTEIRPISREEISTANEVFLTNSLIEIMPVTTLDNRLVGDGKVSPITKRLMEAYRLFVDEEAAFRGE